MGCVAVRNIDLVDPAELLRRADLMQAIGTPEAVMAAVQLIERAYARYDALLDAAVSWGN